MDSVQVAVRVRPLVQIEVEKGCRSCVEVNPETQQIVTKLKGDRFTFNYVYDSDTPQVDVYENSVKNLVLQLFKGYNVTVLAYGQTGSGKTYSMGTCPTANQTDYGIIPRAIHDIFDVINNDDDWIFKVSVSFLELYNEQLIDLLSEKQNVVDLREGARGILIPGLTHRKASSASDILDCLQQGSLNRTTGATAMNAFSSRSHAIFTIYIQQIKKNNEDDATSAKFHLVDLAGSERSKKTKAEGKRFLEGVNINKELFVLGNVISSLCDGAPFVNYRDSKLTRLLQDSLGGNSLTLMLACVSPADSNVDETVNTLRYADRARKIKNKPIVNQDPIKQEISRLKRENEELQLALLAKRGDVSCPPEHQELMGKVSVLNEKNKVLSESLDNAIRQTTSLLERTLMAESSQERMKEILSGLNIEFLDNTIESMNASLSNEQKTALQALKLIFDELKIEHEKSEVERLKHDEKMYVSSPCLKNENGEDDLPEDVEAREDFVLHQAKINQQIQEICKDLVWKEALAAKLAESNTIESSMRSHCEDELTELRTLITSLQHEKEELEQQIKSHRNASVDHKLAEQRRKRVKELEEKITDLNKKILDQDRVLKMKERNEDKIKSLNKEIMSMKQIKVKLINQMKTEGEKYRQWRSTREQELFKLKQQNRQKETKFVKMETLYQKQQNVYKRKLEESASVIKRLKETLALQKLAKDKKPVLGNAEKVSQWVAQEFAAMVNSFEAERTLENLIEDRAILAKEQARLKKLLKDPDLDNEEKKKLSSEIKVLDEDLELRSTQILDLKQKLQSLDTFQDGKSKSRLECVQTMSDAKTTLKYVFETANSYLNDFHKDKKSKEVALQELKENYDAVLLQLKETENMFKDESKKFRKTEKDLNDKIVVLLKRLRSLENEKDSSAGKLPLQELNGTFTVNDENETEKVHELQKKVEELEQKLEEKKSKPKKQSQSVLKTDILNATFTPKTRELLFDDSEEENDDIGNDPDWRKTPIYHKLKNLKADMKGGLKRNLNGQPSCGCRGSCSTRLCTCRKMDAACSGNCRCEDEQCQNKENMKRTSTEANNDSASDDNDHSFKKPRLTSVP